MTEFVQMVINVVDELFLRKTNSGEVSEKKPDEIRRCAMHANGMVQHLPKSSKREVILVVSSSADVRIVHSTLQKAEEFLNHARNPHLILELEIDGLT